MNQLVIGRHPAHAARPLRAVSGTLDWLKARAAAWSARRRERRVLLSLDDAGLQDIGISRAQANFEYNRPVWRG